MKELGIYIHIPFCKKKCDYCDFISHCDKSDLIDEYIEKLKEEDFGIYSQVIQIKEYSGSHIFCDTETKYYSSGEEVFEEMLKACGNKYHLIGDCNKVGNIKDAICQAYEVCKNIFKG